MATWNLRLDDAGAQPLEIAHPALGRVAPFDLTAVGQVRRCPEESDCEPFEPRGWQGALGQHRPHEGDVLDAPGHRPGRIEERNEWKGTLHRNKSPLRLEPDDPARSGGQSDRAACVGAERQVAQPRGQRGRGATRGAARRPTRMGRVVTCPEELALTKHAPCELRKVRLADHDRTRVEQALHRDGIAVGDVVRVDPRPIRRPHAGRVEQILDGERPSGERPGVLARLAARDARDEGVVGVGAHGRQGL